MDRQLLYRAVDRRRQRLKFGALLGLGNVLRQTIGLAGRFGEVVQDLPVEFGPGFFLLRLRGRHASLGLFEMAGLHLQVFLVRQQVLQIFEVSEL